MRIVVLNLIALAAAVLVGMTRAYRRAGSLERRQVRWVLYGVSVSILPGLCQYTLAGLEIPFDWQLIDTMASLFQIAIPLGIAVSVVGYHWLDIDRLISATAAATLLGVAALGGTLAVAPRLARATAAALGIDADATQLALSMALAAVLVPAYRALRPWLDRRLFAEQHALGLAGAERVPQPRAAGVAHRRGQRRAAAPRVDRPLRARRRSLHAALRARARRRPSRRGARSCRCWRRAEHRSSRVQRDATRRAEAP